MRFLRDPPEATYSRDEPEESSVNISTNPVPSKRDTTSVSSHDEQFKRLEKLEMMESRDVAFETNDDRC